VAQTMYAHMNKSISNKKGKKKGTKVEWIKFEAISQFML
jgi:hypothetical protein